MRKSTLIGMMGAAVLAFGGAIAMADSSSDANLAYTLNPAAGSTVTDLQGIIVDFTAVKVAFPDNNRMPSAVLENTTTGDVYVCETPDRNTRAMTDGAEYKLVFTDEDGEALEAISTPGEYTLTIRSMYSGEGENVVYYNPIIANYTIKYPVAYTLTPASGSTVTDLQGITIDFTADKVNFYENSRMPVATLENTTTGTVYTCETPARDTRAMTNGAAYVLVFVDEDGEYVENINLPGEYTLTVRGMAYGTEENPVDLPVITANYTIEYPAVYVLNPESGATVEDLQGITLNFSADKVDFYENSNMPVAVLENTTTGSVYNCELPVRDTKAMTDGVFYTFKFNDEDGDYVETITEPGAYVLTVKAMYIPGATEEENVALPVIIANYTIAYPVAYELTPADGSTVEDLQGIAIDFTAEKVAFYENSNMPVAVLENTTTGAIYNCELPERDTKAMTDGIFYTFKFNDEDGDYMEAISQPGDYTLTIRAMYVPGATEEANVDLPVIVAKYSVAYPAPFVLNPDNGAAVENLQGITIDFTTKKVAFYENSNMACVVLENLTTGTVYTCEEPDRNTKAETDGSFYTFMFKDEDGEYVGAISEPGEYELTIRAAYYEENEENVDVPVIVAHYTIPYPAEYVLTPADGSNIVSFNDVTLEFTSLKVGFYENNRMAAVVLENTTTGKVYNCYEPELDTKAETDGSFYTFKFYDEDDDYVAVINEPGDYELTVRGLCIEVEDADPIDLPVIVAHYTVEYPVEYVLTPAAGSEVEEIDVITLEFPNTKYVGFYENSTFVAVLTNGLEGDEEVAYYCESAVRDTRAMTDGIAYNLVFVDENGEKVTVKESGAWNLTIRALYLADVTEENGETVENYVDLPVINATYYVNNPETKVEGIFTDTNVFNVYTINGIQVVKGGNADAVNNLPAGLYIINGKKVLVRK